MSTLTIRLPDDIAQRLKNVAETRQVSVNKLIMEMSTAYDAETRFKAMAAEADVDTALAVLNRLDRGN